MRIFLATLTILILGITATAHEGHDKTPATLAAPHGGQLKGTSQLYVELVSEPSGFKLYTFDHNLKTVEIKNVKIEGTLKFPKKKQFEKLVLKPSESFLKTEIDAKGSHRYIIDLKVTYKEKTESVTFNVEPQE